MSTKYIKRHADVYIDDGYTRAGNVSPGGGEPEPPHVCVPVTYVNYPWVAALPDYEKPGYEKFFDKPASDGVSFNVNVGGYAPSWTPSGPGTNEVYTVVTAVDPGGFESNFQADGPMNESADGVINLTDHSAEFPIQDPGLLAKYSVGGNWNGDNNLLPGKSTFPSVASGPSWYAGTYFQPKNYGMPIILEMWYSLNPNRSKPLEGYDNYTFIGNQRSMLPQVYVDNDATNKAWIKKYQGGILKLHADMNNLQDSDYILGVSYVGDGTGGVGRLIVDGVVTQSFTYDDPIDNAYVELDFYVGYDVATIGPYKAACYSFIFYLENANWVWPDPRYDGIDSGYSWSSPEQSHWFDTKDIKYAWIVDTHTGIPSGVWDQNSDITAEPYFFYAIPDAPLPCAPTIPEYEPAPPIPVIDFGPPPVADFVGTPLTGNAPLNVQFTDMSTAEPYIWLWNFGDGVTSGEQNPTHSYKTGGKYTVTLTVTALGGQDVETKAAYIDAKAVAVPGQWVAVASNAPAARSIRIATSPEGVNWAPRVAPGSFEWSSVAFANGLYVAVATFGTGSRIMTSPDGTTWTQRTDPSGGIEWQSVVGNGSIWVAVAQTNWPNHIMTSPDGITWTMRAGSLVPKFAHGVCWSAERGLFVAVGGLVGQTETWERISTSPDGINWTQRTAPTTTTELRHVAYGNGQFVAIGSSTNNAMNGIATSPDGITWTQRVQPYAVPGYVKFTGVVYAPELSLWVVVGQGNSSTDTKIMTSVDGITWTAQAVPVTDMGLLEVAWSGTRFVAVGSTTGTRVLTSTDGINWTVGTTPVPAAWASVCWGTKLPAQNIFPAVWSEVTAGTEDLIGVSAYRGDYTYLGAYTIHGTLGPSYLIVTKPVSLADQPATLAKFSFQFTAAAGSAYPVLDDMTGRAPSPTWLFLTFKGYDTRSICVVRLTCGASPTTTPVVTFAKRLTSPVLEFGTGMPVTRVGVVGNNLWVAISMSPFANSPSKYALVKMNATSGSITFQKTYTSASREEFKGTGRPQVIKSLGFTDAGHVLLAVGADLVCHDLNNGNILWQRHITFPDYSPNWTAVTIDDVGPADTSVSEQVISGRYYSDTTASAGDVPFAMRIKSGTNDKGELVWSTKYKSLDNDSSKHVAMNLGNYLSFIGPGSGYNTVLTILGFDPATGLLQQNRVYSIKQDTMVPRLTSMAWMSHVDIDPTLVLAADAACRVTVYAEMHKSSGNGLAGLYQFDYSQASQVIPLPGLADSITVKRGEGTAAGFWTNQTLTIPSTLTPASPWAVVAEPAENLFVLTNDPMTISDNLAASAFPKAIQDGQTS